MKGTLHKTDRGWIVRYNPNPHEGVSKIGTGPGIRLKQVDELRLHPDDVPNCKDEWLEADFEGKEVEFEMVKIPSDSTTDEQQWQQMNRQEKDDFLYDKYAHLILPTKASESGWDDIWSELVKHLEATDGKYVGQGWEWLKQNYHPPLKR